MWSGCGHVPAVRLASATPRRPEKRRQQLVGNAPSDPERPEVRANTATVGRSPVHARLSGKCRPRKECPQTCLSCRQPGCLVRETRTRSWTFSFDKGGIYEHHRVEGATIAPGFSFVLGRGLYPRLAVMLGNRVHWYKNNLGAFPLIK